MDELSPGRAAALGAIAGTVLPLVWLVVALVPEASSVIPLRMLLLALLAGSGTYGAPSAALAATTVALAKRAPTEIAPGPESGVG